MPRPKLNTYAFRFDDDTTIALRKCTLDDVAMDVAFVFARRYPGRSVNVFLCGSDDDETERHVGTALLSLAANRR